MRCSRLVLGAALVAGLATMGLPSSSRAESAPIFLDGFFTDWTGPIEHVDPAGDGVAGGIDMRDLDLANDGEFLFARFQLTAEIGLQESNTLVLYLDTDLNAGTGTPVSGIGAELKWNFGPRNGTFWRPNQSTLTVFQDDIRLRQLPSITSTQFEIAIGRDVRPDGANLLFTGNSVRVLLRHEVTGGDQAPNAAQTLTYTFDPTAVPPPAPIPLERQQANDVRVTTWNVLNLENQGGGWNGSVTPNADRVFSAIHPDIVCFQEIYDNTPAATAALMESFLPSGEGEAWYARDNFDVIVVSRFPVLGNWSLNGTVGGGGNANVGVLLDTQVRLGHQLLVVGAHMFCCTNNTGRQDEADHIMSFINDAKNPSGTITVPFGTVFLITGDLNLVGQSQQLTTLLTGDIVNNSTYGADFAPDWDGTPLRDLVSSQTEKRLAYTWRNDNSSFAPGRLDFFIYSDSTAQVGNHFVLYTPEMSAAQLSQYGLQANDVTTVSDHVPHTADFRNNIPTDVRDDQTATTRPQPWAQLRAGRPPRTGGARLLLKLERSAQVSIDIYDVRGAHVTTLSGEAAGDLAAGLHAITWDGRTARGARASSGTYVARLLAQSGGVALATSTKLTLLR